MTGTSQLRAGVRFIQKPAQCSQCNNVTEQWHEMRDAFAYRLLWRQSMRSSQQAIHLANAFSPSKTVCNLRTQLALLSDRVKLELR